MCTAHITPKPANVGVTGEQLLRAAPSNHTDTAVSQFRSDALPTHHI
jgi:hypothetical protein